MKRFLAVVVAVALLSLAAQAGEKVWPNGTPTVVVGFGPGGGTDNAVRPLIVAMSEYLGETINVTNMPGASSALAAEHVMSQPHDGYNLLATGTGIFGGYLVQNTGPNSYPWKWVSWFPIQGPSALLANPEKSGINTFADALAKLKDGSASVGMAGFGNGPHVHMETIASLAGIKDVNYVTFDGDSAVAAGVLAGDLELGIITFSSGIDHAKTGKLKALFVNQTTPLKLTDSIVVPPITQVFPPAKDMPMLAEAWGVLIPADAPKRIIDKLEEAFRHALKQPRLIDYAKSKEQNVVGLSGEDAAKMLDYQFSAYAYAMYQPSRPDHVNPAGKLVKPSEWNWEVEKKKYGY